MKKLLLFSLIACAGSALLAQLAAFTPSNKLRYAEQAIAMQYVDTVDEDKIVEAGIVAMLKELDPHSSYTNAEETRAMNEPLEGNFSGIGISYNMVEDTLYVANVIGGGPSEKAGIMPGDRIIAVNDSSIAGMKYKTSEIMKRLRGPKGTVVDLTVLRLNDTIPFRLTRDNIPVYSVDAAYMADPTTGYISLSRFAENSAKEFREAILKLRKQGMKNLILDLTGNGGGYLGTAIEILGELLEPNSMAVYTEGSKSPRRNYYVSPDGVAPLMGEGRVVVMVDQTSASASEITSGALQDYDRAVIVGRRTFGKGLVQRPVPFPDGSMMRLTVSHYYIPSGRDIQKPYVKGEKDAYNEDLLNRLKHGELMNKDSLQIDSTKLTSTLRLGRPVYGGGGVIPDCFVPLDTMAFTPYMRNLSAKMILVQAAAHYVDNHRKEIKKRFKTDDSFVAGFTVPESLMNYVRERGDAEGVEFNAEQWERSKEFMAVNLKALIGRNIYDNQTFDKVYNLANPIYNEALRLINSEDYDKILSPN